MESIEEVIFIVISLLLLLMGIVLLGSIIMSSYNPYQQITFANVEKLRSTFNEVCYKNNAEAVKVSFEMPQNTPMLPNIFTVIPAWIIKSSGDPNYVLYYESFPPGEANGWEVYHSFENRLLTYLPDNLEGLSAMEVEEKAREAVKKFSENNKNQPLEAVVFTNILLSDKYRSDFIIKQTKMENVKTGSEDSESQGIAQEVEFVKGGEEKTDPSQGYFGYGKWQGNFFKFNNYASLSALEKTLIKYQLCGADSLCLKTREGIYTYPMEMCKNIKGVQLVYDARNRGVTYVATAAGIAAVVFAGKLGIIGKGISWIAKKLIPGIGKFIIKKPSTWILAGYGAEEAAQFVASQFLSYKTSDFYLASPCSMKGDTQTVDVKNYDTATDDEGDETIVEKDEKVTLEYDFKIKLANCEEADVTGANPDVCQNVIKYPLYKYDDSANGDGKLHYIKDANGNKKYHYVCVEKIGDADDTEVIGNDPPVTDNDDYYKGTCLQVFVDTRPKDFCWTDDPWKRRSSFSDFDTQAALWLTGQITGMDAIVDTTAYISSSDNKIGDIMVLKETGFDKSIFEKIGTSQITWTWPK